MTESVLESPVVASFCEWMRQQRGASDATLSIYRFELRAFIKELGEDPSMYDARNLRSFVLRKSRHSGGASTRKSICAIRMFLRFLISQGKCPASLYASVPSLAHWRLSALPRYLQPAQVEKIIASADLRTSLGSRNRAILLLLARLGLRAGDIVRLRFSDIDWKEGTISVSGKGRRATVLPLSQEVGQALAAYIKDHRPQADSDAVFVRSFAPYRAFTGSTSISIIVARAMRCVDQWRRETAVGELRHVEIGGPSKYWVSYSDGFPHNREITDRIIRNVIAVRGERIKVPDCTSRQGRQRARRVSCCNIPITLTDPRPANS